MYLEAFIELYTCIKKKKKNLVNVLHTISVPVLIYRNESFVVRKWQSPNSTNGNAIYDISEGVQW